MRSHRRRSWRVLAATLAGLLAAAAARAFPPPWQRTETREPCAQVSPLRSPYFGDLHVHTGFSHDAYPRGTRTEPSDAYAFARGAEVTLPDPVGAQTRTARIDRPLDFVAVTDHAEFLGEMRACITPTNPAFNLPMCAGTRVISDPFTETIEFAQWGLPLGVQDPPPDHLFCNDVPGIDCSGNAAVVWLEIQAAAEEAYDRTATCAFTTFVGYENTASPSGAHLHRNVIFRNEHVPAVPASYLETGQGGAVQPLFTLLEQDCLDAGTGCDAVVIPHNSNLSQGLRWPDPLDAADARRRQAREPLVEIFQHKAASECRFDRLKGIGADTVDELCTFEQDPRERQGPFPLPPIETYPRRNMVRNVLKDGLVFEQSLGVNPFRLGFIGSTDTHDATPGNTAEIGWPGHQGYQDADAAGRLGSEGFGASRIRFNPGGLAVVWAEENSRDALFAALRRRETYATSGTRPVLRFFAGDLARVRCGGADFVEHAYESGTPMGGEIGPVRGRRSPRFAVLAAKDPGTATRAGADLQRVQVVKGWVDGAGTPHEQVFDVAGNAANGATVNPVTCEPEGHGANQLCTVWEDPEFDPAERAFYYVRALENPTCRWSTLLCKGVGVDLFSPDCATQAATAGPPFNNCCLDETNDPFMEPVIQERAWTSPIWYRPEGIARVRGAVKFGPHAGADALKLSLRIGAVPAAFDPASEDLVLRVTDDDEIWTATIPAGTLVERRAGRFAYADRTGSIAGITRATFDVRANGIGQLRVRTRRIDLAHADRTDHMVKVELAIGGYEAEQTRLWRAGTGRLAPRSRGA